MENLISHTSELAVEVGGETAKLVYMLTGNAKSIGQESYEVAVTMRHGGKEEREIIQYITAPRERVFEFFKRLVEGIVMPMSLGEIVEDFLALQE